MEDNFVIDINALGVKKTKEIVDEYNKSLGDLRDALIDEYGTCDINSAISIAIAMTALNIGIEIAEALLTFGMSEISTGMEMAEKLPPWSVWWGEVKVLPDIIQYDPLWKLTEDPEQDIQILVAMPEIMKQIKLSNGGN